MLHEFHNLKSPSGPIIRTSLPYACGHTLLADLDFTPTIKVCNRRTPSQSKHKQRRSLAEVIGTPRDNVISATRGQRGSHGLSMDACAEKENGFVQGAELNFSFL
jgi:hypothetical protein